MVYNILSIFKKFPLLLRLAELLVSYLHQSGALAQDLFLYKNNPWDNGRNQDPLRNSTIMMTTIWVPVVTIYNHTILTINTTACIFVPLLFRSLGCGNRTFYFRCCIDLSSCDFVIFEWCREC